MNLTKGGKRDEKSDQFVLGTGTLTFITDHFSYYAVVAVPSSNSGLIIGIAVVLCAAAAAAFVFYKKYFNN